MLDLVCCKGPSWPQSHLQSSLAHKAVSLSQYAVCWGSDHYPVWWVAQVAHSHLALCRILPVLAGLCKRSLLHVTWPFGSSRPMWPYTYLPDFFFFLAEWGRRCCFSASEITWGPGCSPPTWSLYDIKLKVCAICPQVWGSLGYIACWHSVEKCVRWRKLILMKSYLYSWLRCVLRVNYPLNHAEDFPWERVTGAPQERGACKKIILTRLQ